MTMEVIMKKLLLIGALITTSISLVGCVNQDSSNKKANKDVKTEQSKVKPKKEKTELTERDNKEKATKNVDDQPTKTNTNEKSANQSEPSTDEKVNQGANNGWVVHNAVEAKDLLTKQLGDQGWNIDSASGTFGGAHSGYDENGKPNPVPDGYIPYVTIANSKGEAYTVSATGEIKPMNR